MKCSLIFGWIFFLVTLTCRGQDTVPSLDLRLLERLNHAAGPDDKKWQAVSNSLNLTVLPLR